MNVIDTPGDYARGLFTRLGDRDWMAVLGATPAALRAAFDGVDDAAIRRAEAPGKWSMIDVAHHLADGEMVVGVRVRMIVAQEQPPITAYDQELLGRDASLPRRRARRGAGAVLGHARGERAPGAAAHGVAGSRASACTRSVAASRRATRCASSRGTTWCTSTSWRGSARVETRAT